MGRQAKPWWWAAKGRWAATIAGKRAVAPAGIDEGDVDGAWRWYLGAKDRALADVPAGGELLVADVLNAYVDHAKKRVTRGTMHVKTLGVATSVFKKAVEFRVSGKRFGEIPAADVGVRHLQTVISAWAERPGTRPETTVTANWLATASRWILTAYRWASHPSGGRDPLIARYPFEGYKVPRTSPAKVRIPTPQEAAAWLRWIRRMPGKPAPEGYVLLQRLLITTGARPSEWTRAKWSEIEWAAGTTPYGATYGRLVREEWKNARRVSKDRRILIPPTLLRALRRRYEEKRPDPGDLIFGTPAGRPWSSQRLCEITRRVRARAKDAKVAIPAEGEGRLRDYAWRHAAASRLISRGVDPITAADLLGTSVKMLERVYTHLNESHLAAAAMPARVVRRRKTESRDGSGSTTGPGEATS